ncbi:Mitochondria fission 1 protein [Trametes pubescens]|uniref:Mitochondrial fission 1 protein n=1 Tax=Trametes pubescens TaxID=154538 RepID=A0A1M2V2R7_TRAPU|nr:Mitochondria fission 1 protein [Trametes pubescens]
MPTELPYAADAEESLSFDELEVLKLQYQKELAQSHVTVQTKFNYAWGLVKSPQAEHQVEGVRLLQGAHSVSDNLPASRTRHYEVNVLMLSADIYRAEPGRRRECLYYLALGHYKMGNYEEARRFNALLLDKEPSNLQAQSLASLIDTRVTREGYIGMAIVGGLAALSTLALATIIRRASRK